MENHKFVSLRNGIGYCLNNFMITSILLENRGKNKNIYFVLKI